MDRARRLYVYVAAALGLLAAAYGLILTLTFVLEEIVDLLAPTGLDIAFGGGADALRRAVALLLVGGPVWAIHWWLIRRSVRDSSARLTETASASRATYLALVALLAVLAVLAAASRVVSWVVGLLVGTPASLAASVTGDVALLVVAALIAWYHATVRSSDVSRTVMRGGAVSRPRLARFAVAGIALVVGLWGTGESIAVLLHELLAPRVAGNLGEFGWQAPFADAVGRAVAGLAIWLVAWLRGVSILRDGGWAADTERGSRLRVGYLLGVVLLGAAAFTTGLATALHPIVRALAGLERGTPTAVLVQDVAGPAVLAAPFAVAAWFHARQYHVEVGWRRVGSTTASRTVGLLIALVGIVTFAVGLGRLLGLAAEQVLAGGRVFGPGIDEDLVQFGTYAAAGGATWLWTWIRELRFRSASAAEDRATAPRAYLFTVAGLGIAALVPTLVFVVYRVLTMLMEGVRVGTEDASTLGIALGYGLVGLAVVAYHGLLIRRDRFATAGAVPTAEASVPVRIQLVIEAPPGTDPAATIALVRAALPRDQHVEVTEPREPMLPVQRVHPPAGT